MLPVLRRPGADFGSHTPPPTPGVIMHAKPRRPCDAERMSPSSDDTPPGASSPLRDLLRVAADQAAVVAENVERVYRGSFVSTDTLPGVYRGTVAANDDPLGRGRLQVLVPEAGSEPTWAEVARALDGGAGVRPETGAVVWVAFERGAASSPVVLGLLGG